MKRIVFLGLCCGLFLLAPGGAEAYTRPISSPTAVLFYPNEVHVTVEEKLTPEPIPHKGQGLVIVLPHSADKASFSVSLNGKQADSFYWLNTADFLQVKSEPGGKVTTEKLLVAVGGTAQQEDKETAERRSLRTAVETLRGEIEAKAAGLAATEARLKLWQTPLPEKDLTADDLIKLDTAYSQHLAALHEAKARHTRQLEEMRARMSKAEKSLLDYDNALARHVAVIPMDGQNVKAGTVRYSYIMPATCSTAYRLNALPAKDIVTIDQEAEVMQSSGQTWTNVDVFVSTGGRDKRLRPRPLPAWVISLQDKDAPVPAARSAAPSAVMYKSEQNSTKDMVQAAGAPVAAERGTYRLWSLGKRTIENGVSVTLPLASNEYKASFYYTLQPSTNATGFLTAELMQDKAFELPRGTARFFVDNSLVGVQPLSVNGNKATLFFGSDPLVTATMVDRKHSSGEKGFINKEQSLLWDWEITVRNGRSWPITAVVQDPFPDSRNDTVKISAESKPVPEQTTSSLLPGGSKVYSWKLTLTPGESETILHRVNVLAPADKILRPGRR